MSRLLTTHTIRFMVRKYFLFSRHERETIAFSADAKKIVGSCTHESKFDK